MTEQLPFHFSLSCIGEGNGNLLQCPCLENPRDRGAWWASVYGIAQSQTRLKQLSSGGTLSMHTGWSRQSQVPILTLLSLDLRTWAGQNLPEPVLHSKKKDLTPVT